MSKVALLRCTRYDDAMLRQVIMDGLTKIGRASCRERVSSVV